MKTEGFTLQNEDINEGLIKGRTASGFCSYDLRKLKFPGMTSCVFVRVVSNVSKVRSSFISLHCLTPKKKAKLFSKRL